ncbi:MAG: nucleoside-diphosphate sugar epimerase/dehydratase, partial [Bacteroidota bacterium]
MAILNKHTPRWIIFMIDIAICTFSVMLAYLLRFNFNIPDIELPDMKIAIPVVIGIRAFSFIAGKTYAGIIRYTSTKDAERIFLVILAGSVAFILANMVRFYLIDRVYLIPLSIIIIDFITTVFIMTSSRLLIKILFMEMNHSQNERTNVIIYGTGQLGMIAKRTIDRDTVMNHRVIAFIDNDKHSVKSTLEGATIYNLEKLDELFDRYEIEKLIISQTELSPEIRDQLIEKCLNHNVQVLTVPEASNWINGELSVKQIKNLRIEDLLERAPIKLDEKQIRKQTAGKVVLVTGAAGSIGSEIAHQLTRFKPQAIVLYDQAESPLHELELEMTEKRSYHECKVIIGDITNQERLEYIFSRYQPSIVYHAAAYKHVPMMEKNPAEAVITNVKGTKIVADLSVKFGVKKFVMISTDKAVNPTNVMGASKRISEMYVQVLNKQSDTAFIVTRFGNVLGSNGSVIPRFRKQIEEGGPVTITHPEVTRYFMTIPEACQLVLEAGAMGNGGEVFLFDMGKSVKIQDLAKKMIKLSGLGLGKDINIKFTGLRPGEKLYEELLCDQENSLPTHHPQIMIGKQQEYHEQEIIGKTNELLDIVSTFD